MWGRGDVLQARKLHNFTNLPYPFGVYPHICEQQVDFGHTTTFRFCILCLDFWLLQKFVELWGFFTFVLLGLNVFGWLKHGCGIGMFVLIVGVKLEVLLCILNLPVWLPNQNMQCILFAFKHKTPNSGLFHYKGCPCLNSGFCFLIFLYPETDLSVNRLLLLPAW